MKILFVYPNFTKQRTPQIGVASLLSIVTKNHQTAFFDFSVVPHNPNFDANGNIILGFKSYKNMFLDFKPDYVMISCRSNEWGLVKEMVKISYPTPVIVGGAHPTVVPEEVLAYAKIIVRGEGEGTVEELLDKLESGRDITSIPNVWTKSGGKVWRNDVRPLIQDLDTLPTPLWQAFNRIHFYGSYIKDLFNDIECVGTFETSRGCPYACTYCCNYFIQKLYEGKGKYHRRKSPKRVNEEIKNFKKIYPDCNFIYFVDDTFMVDKDWLVEFSQYYDKTPFVFMTRAEMATLEKIKIVADMGAKAVSIGIESGNEKFRKEVYNRQMSNTQIIQAFRNAKDCGLHTYSFNMVGAPYETPNDILSTINLNKRIKPDIAQFTTFYPLPGTKLFEICKKEGYLKEDYPELFSYYNKSILSMPQLSNDEIELWKKRGERLTPHKRS